METRAPTVVAVVVTSDPDDTLEVTLRSLAEQDYAELSTLVIVNRGPADVPARVAAAHPEAFVSVLEHDHGFGAAVNAALEKVEGASFLLLCHDDVRLQSDAVHLMVEEAFRSNAGIVTPKVVSMADSSVLLHVGQSVDRYGTVIERVQPGEVDQGQHDAVRDVFVAPGGVTLVRDDLLRLLGGYDDRYVAMGDDLELCWRARLAGARIVCAPDAVVAHSERLVSGTRELFTPAGEDAPPTLSRLRRRNEVRTLVACWGLWERILSIGLLLVWNLGEILVSVVGSDHQRAVDIRESWRVWWRERKADRQRRATVAKVRTESDRTIRSLQAKGATRARTFVATLFQHGFDVALGAIPVAIEHEAGPELTASFGGAFSDDEGFDELDDLGRRGARTAGRRRLSSARSIMGLGALALAIFLIGSRNLVGVRLPLLGQLLPLRSWGATWHMAFASWQPAGLGSGAPGQPGYLSLGLLGTLTLGQMGAAVRILLLAGIPVGAYGVSRMLRGLASGRARLLAAVAFGGLALGVNAIAAGEVGAVVALAAMPSILRRSMHLLGAPPFEQPFEVGPSVATRGWRRTRTGQIVALGLLLALVGSLAPAVLVATGASAVGLVAFGLVSSRRPVRGLGGVVLALLISLVLLAPMLIPAVLSGSSGLGAFGAAAGPWSEPGIGGLIRFAVGPSGSTPLAWLLPAAALVPLLVARGPRLALSARLLGVVLSSFALGLLVARGGVGPFAPDLLVVLAPAATGLAAMVGLGLAAFEVDLPGFRFGWRQLVALGGITASLVGILPLVGSSISGRWNMPQTGYTDALTFLDGPKMVGHRVLWLGDPRGIPGGSWTISPGLAWATSTGGLPSNANLFVPPSPTAGPAVTEAIELAMSGSTVRLGRLLAPTGISAIVVVTAAAPHVANIQIPQQLPPPPKLVPALLQQSDLVEVPGSGSSVVFEVSHSIPMVGARSAPLPAGAKPTDPLVSAGWTDLGGLEASGSSAPAGSKTGYLGLAPASAFSLSTPGTDPKRASAFGWAASTSISPGPVTLRLEALPIAGILSGATLLAWLVAVLCLLGRHRWLDWWWPAGRTRKGVDLDVERAADPSGSDLVDEEAS
jgi:GT2 family glycosyltransferase